MDGPRREASCTFSPPIRAPSTASRRKNRTPGPAGRRVCDAADVAPPLFTYGTLMPGHLRWGVLEPHVVGWRPAAVEGRLYDTGEGWPAAVFGPGADVVKGWAIDLRPEVADVVLAHLDEVEGVVEGLFRRVEVTLLGGEPATSYELGPAADGLARIAAWDRRDEA